MACSESARNAISFPAGRPGTNCVPRYQTVEKAIVDALTAHRVHRACRGQLCEKLPWIATYTHAQQVIQCLMRGLRISKNGGSGLVQRPILSRRI